MQRRRRRGGDRRYLDAAGRTAPVRGPASRRTGLAERCGSRTPSPRHRRCRGRSRRRSAPPRRAAAGGRHWRTGCAPAAGAGYRRTAGSGPRPYRRMHRRHWPRPTSGEASRATARRSSASGASQSSASRNRTASPLPPAPSRKGRGSDLVTPPPLAGGGWGEGAHAQKLANSLVPRRRNAGVRLPDQAYPRIGETRHNLAGPIRRSIIDDDQDQVAMRLRQHRRDRVADPRRGIEGRDDNADAHALSVRIGAARKT